MNAMNGTRDMEEAEFRIRVYHAYAFKKTSHVNTDEIDALKQFHK